MPQINKLHKPRVRPPTSMVRVWSARLPHGHEDEKGAAYGPFIGHGSCALDAVCDLIRDIKRRGRDKAVYRQLLQMEARQHHA